MIAFTTTSQNKKRRSSGAVFLCVCSGAIDEDACNACRRSAALVSCVRRIGGGTCCGAYKPERCEIRTRHPRDVRLTDTELVVVCRDATDAVLTFLVVDGAVVLVLPDTVARTALAVDAAR